MSAVALVRSEASLPFTVGAIGWDPTGRWLVVGAAHQPTGPSPVGGVARIDATTGRVAWRVDDEWRVTGIVVRPNGLKVAVAAQRAGDDSTATGLVRVLNSATGQQLSGTAGQGGVGYSPDGRLLVFKERFASAHRVLLVDAETGQTVRNDLGPTGGTAAFSPDSKLLAIADGTAFVVWDLVANARLGTGPTTRTRLSFTADNRRLVVYGANKAVTFDVRTGAVVADVSLDLLPATLLDSVRPRLISPDGRTIAAHLGRGVALCAVDDGHRLFLRQFPALEFRFAGALAFSPSSHYLATDRILADQTTTGPPAKGVAVVDARTGAVLWEDGREEVFSLAYNHDGSLLAAGGRTASGGGFVRVYDARRLVRPGQQCRGRVVQVAAASTGARRVAAADVASTATVFDADTGEVLVERSHTGVLSSIGLSADGRHLATGTTAQLVHLFAADGGAKLWAARQAGTISAVAISPRTGQWVATACSDRTARLYHRDVVTGEPAGDHPFRWKNTHPQSVTDIAISSDERWVATTCADRTTRVLDALTGAERHRIPHPNGRATALEFSRTGTLLAIAVTDGTALVVDAATGTVRRTFTHPGDVVAAAINADGTVLATVGSEFKVRVWNLASATPVHTFPHTGPVSALAFDPADRSLAIATEAGVVAVFDVGPGVGVEQYRITHPAAVRHIAFSSDGSVLATACDDRFARSYTRVPP